MNYLAECTQEMDAPQTVEQTGLTDNARISEVFATLGHEMRNPLCAISYALQVWKISQHETALLAKLHAVIERQLHQLTRLSEDLVDAARMSQGKLELRRTQFKLSEVIDAASEQVHPLIHEREQTLRLELPAVPMILYADRARLIQVFANLIQNAAKFTSRGGSLSVTAESQDGTALVRVRDNGPGIERHRLTTIFDRFARGNEDSAASNNGLGIGLALVKEIVELHGGSVAADSAGMGQGSEFTLLLPLC